METRRLEVIDALCHVLVGEAVHTLQFDDELVLHHKVGSILPNASPLVQNRKRYLGPGIKPSCDELLEQSSLVNLLKESASEQIRDLVSGAHYHLG